MTIPVLPDTERLTTYTISGSTGPLNVGFHIYADDDDYENWIEVWLDGVQLTPVTHFTVDSPSGTLSDMDRPITDARVTFTSARTGDVVIVGARRPRRTSVFTSGQAIPIDTQNYTINDLMAVMREFWDLRERMFLVPPGDQGGVFDGDFGDGNVLGAASSTDNAIARFDGTTGKIIQSSLVTIDDSGNLSTPGSITASMSSSQAEVLNLISTNADALAGPILSLFRDSASPAADDLLGTVLFRGRNSAAATVNYAGIYSHVHTTTAGSETSHVHIDTYTNGVIETLTFAGTTITGGFAAGGTLTLKGTTSASPSGDSVSIMSGTKNILQLAQNPAGDVGGTYLKLWPGNTAGFQNCEFDVISSLSAAGVSFRMKGDWPFVIHAPSDQSASAKMALYEQESNGTNRMVWQAAASIASDFTLVWPSAVPAVSDTPLVCSSAGVLSFGNNTSVTGSAQIQSGTAIPAGGTAGAGYKLSSTSNFGIFFGSGAPSLSAAKGSLYLRSDGSATNNRSYVNTDGGTTWTAINTSA